MINKRFKKTNPDLKSSMVDFTGDSIITNGLVSPANRREQDVKYFIKSPRTVNMSLQRNRDA